MCVTIFASIFFHKMTFSRLTKSVIITKRLVNDLSKLRSFTLPYIPSPQGRGRKEAPSPLAGEGWGERYANLFLALTINLEGGGNCE